MFNCWNRSRLPHIILIGGMLLGLLHSLAIPALAIPSVALAQVSSLDDFATRELGDPWDMNNTSDIDYWFTRTKGNVSGVTFQNGLLEATATNGDPRIWIRMPTPSGATTTPREGSYKPINANEYYYLTVRIYVPSASAWQATWNASAGSPFGQSKFVDIAPGWNITTIDLREGGFGASGAAWSGSIAGFSLDPTINDPNMSFKIDFIRLSKVTTTVPISWNTSGLSGSVDISIGTSANDKTKIASVPATQGSYSWQTSLAAGSYSVFVQKSGANVGGSPLTLPVNAVPKLTITAPSYISGPDYASTVVGNAWDMSDAADISAYKNINSATFSNGIFQGINNSGNDDPNMTLRVTTPIDTSKFKYATYRMYIDVLPDPLRAPVARYLWWTTRPEEASTTDDIVAYEGWETLSFDLTKIALEPGSPSWTSRNPSIFRLDPHEYTDPRSFQLDYVMLTGDDVASTDFAIRYQASDADGGTPQVHFFYDPDNAGFNGTAITCDTNTSVPDGQHRVFLPLIISNSGLPPVQATGSTCRWNTANIPAGSYYIYGVAADSVDTVRIYSQTKVIVSH